MSESPFPRRIDLEPADWFIATWRNLDPLPKPAAAPFDLKALAERLGKVKASQAGWGWPTLPPVLNRQEALFWFEAMTQATPSTKPRELALHLGRQTFDKEMTKKEVVARLKRGAEYASAALVVPLANLLTVEEAVGLVVDGELQIDRRHSVAGMGDRTLDRVVVRGFRRYLRPYLDASAVAALKERVAPALDPEKSTDFWGLPAVYVLAASLGMPEQLRAVVSTWADGFLAEKIYYHREDEKAFVVFGLGSPEEVVTQARRLKLPLEKGEHVRAWLAHTETAALSDVRDAILACTSKEVAEELTEALGLARCPETVSVMLELKLKSRGPQPARRWLDEEVDVAIPGLVPVAAGRGTLADAAAEQLRALARKGHGPAIENALAHFDATIAGRVRRVALESQGPTYTPLDEASTPDWLAPATQGKPAKAPAWLDPSALPPVALGDRCLNPAQVVGLLQALRESTLERPAPLVVDLKRHAERSALDAFAWALFDRWLTEGAPSKDKWALTALGLIGGDSSALKLTPLVRAWPGESQHKRATHGLEVLGAMGTETALMQLGIIADKVKFPALQKRARDAMQDIAKSQGLTREQLDDRIVPTLGLDERGTRVFDYGTRQFKVALGPDLKPMVREEGGKLKADLPRPGVKDDAHKAAEALAEWKLLKKQLRETLKSQAERLERAMIERRKWAPKEFETYFVRHPLTGHLTRNLLWGCYDEGGQLSAAFRVTEDRTYHDAEDNPFTLPEGARVGLVHPLQMKANDLRQWGEVFADHEILSPFPQLGRQVFTLEEGEKGQNLLTRFDGKTVSGWGFLGLLKKPDWQAGAYEGGRLRSVCRLLPEAGLKAVIRFSPGLYGEYGMDPGDQTLEGVFFLPETAETAPRSTPAYLAPAALDPAKAVPLGTVDPMAMSEILGMLSGWSAR